MIDKLQQVLDHLEAAGAILLTIEKPANANYQATSIQKAMEKIDDANSLVIARLKIIEEHKLYVAKGGKPWPALLEG
jgi:hypothetical protein